MPRCSSVNHICFLSFMDVMRNMLRDIQLPECFTHHHGHNVYPLWRSLAFCIQQFNHRNCSVMLGILSSLSGHNSNGKSVEVFRQHIPPPTQSCGCPFWLGVKKCTMRGWIHALWSFFYLHASSSSDFLYLHHPFGLFCLFRYDAKACPWLNQCIINWKMFWRKEPFILCYRYSFHEQRMYDFLA